MIRGIGYQGRSAGSQVAIASAYGRFTGRNGLMSFPSARLDTRLIVVRKGHGQATLETRYTLARERVFSV